MTVARRLDEVESKLGTVCEMCAPPHGCVIHRPGEPEPVATCSKCGRQLLVIRVVYVPGGSRERQSQN